MAYQVRSFGVVLYITTHSHRNSLLLQVEELAGFVSVWSRSSGRLLGKIVLGTIPETGGSFLLDWWEIVEGNLATKGLWRRVRVTQIFWSRKISWFWGRRTSS
jgi:hypothetical protein